MKSASCACAWKTESHLTQGKEVAQGGLIRMQQHQKNQKNNIKSVTSCKTRRCYILVSSMSSQCRHLQDLYGPLATNRKWNYPNYPLWPGTLPDICVRANWESTESNINQLLIKNILHSGLVSSPIPSICIHFTSFHYISIDCHLFSIHGN